MPSLWSAAVFCRFGYPVVPVLYIVAAAVILYVLFVYQTATTWSGLIIVPTGVLI